MCVHPGRAAALFLSCSLFGGEFAQAQFGPAANSQQQQQPQALTPEQRVQVEAWRRQYPYVSLADRLKYEQPHREDAAPKLSPASERQMTALDGQYHVSGQWANRRARSLEMLHSEEVEKFIAAEGFGVRRMDMSPAPQYLPGHSSPPVDFVKVSPLSAEKSDLAATPFLLGEQDKAGKTRVEMLELLPTRSEIYSYHQQSLNTFASIQNFGHVKSVDQVAGFLPHAFFAAPQMPMDSHRNVPYPTPPGVKVPPDPKSWKIARLALVSLLKQSEPRVYESEHLPRMDELKGAQTRPLNKFEKESLARLRDGDELPTASTTNRIELLGSLRASKHCVQCHEVPYGTLLGAFSYELRRDPPLKLEQQPANLQ